MSSPASLCTQKTPILWTVTPLNSWPSCWLPLLTFVLCENILAASRFGRPDWDHCSCAWKSQDSCDVALVESSRAGCFGCHGTRLAGAWDQMLKTVQTDWPLTATQIQDRILPLPSRSAIQNTNIHSYAQLVRMCLICFFKLLLDSMKNYFNLQIQQTVLCNALHCMLCKHAEQF